MGTKGTKLFPEERKRNNEGNKGDKTVPSFIDIAVSIYLGLKRNFGWCVRCYRGCGVGTMICYGLGR